MRMKYLSLIAIFSFVCFTGCGISDDARTPSNDESATYYLCKYWWHAEYVDVHNTRYIQELDFHKDGTGVEIIGKHQQANGNSTREEYHFKWNWGSSHKTISVQYDEGNAVFMDNVFIADRKFSYKMMGEEYFLTDLIKVIIKILSEFTVISVTRLISFFSCFDNIHNTSCSCSFP